MKNFSSESLTKYRILNFLLPVLGYVMSRRKKPLTFVDAHAGPGYFTDKEGHHAGSPMIFYDTASMLQAAIRLVLIDNDPVAYDRLFRLMVGLPSLNHVQILPILGCAEDHVSRVVDMAGDGPVLVFSDPCGCEVPTLLADVSDRSNVTLLMRYSAVAAWRTKKGKSVRTKFKKIGMPYWRYGAGDPYGVHKFRMLLGTHDRQLAEACGMCLEPISGPDDPRILS